MYITEPTVYVTPTYINQTPTTTYVTEETNYTPQPTTTYVTESTQFIQPTTTYVNAQPTTTYVNAQPTTTYTQSNTTYMTPKIVSEPIITTNFEPKTTYVNSSNVQYLNSQPKTYSTTYIEQTQPITYSSQNIVADGNLPYTISYEQDGSGNKVEVRRYKNGMAPAEMGNVQTVLTRSSQNIVQSTPTYVQSTPITTYEELPGITYVENPSNVVYTNVTQAPIIRTSQVVRKSVSVNATPVQTFTNFYE